MICFDFLFYFILFYFILFSKVKAIFGFGGSDNIGKTAFPAVQACPAFPSTFHIPFKGALDMPCLIPCAIDQVRYKCRKRGRGVEMMK